MHRPLHPAMATVAAVNGMGGRWQELQCRRLGATDPRARMGPFRRARAASALQNVIRTRLRRSPRHGPGPTASSRPACMPARARPHEFARPTRSPPNGPSVLSAQAKTRHGFALCELLPARTAHFHRQRASPRCHRRFPTRPNTIHRHGVERRTASDTFFINAASFSSRR